jgi:hypothetical protein
LYQLETLGISAEPKAKFWSILHKEAIWKVMTMP